MNYKHTPAYREIAEIARYEGIIPAVPEDEEDLVNIVHKLFEHIGIVPKQLRDNTNTFVR